MIPHVVPWLTNTNTDSALFFFRTLPTPEQNPLYASDDRRSTISRKIHACLALKYLICTLTRLHFQIKICIMVKGRIRDRIRISVYHIAYNLRDPALECAKKGLKI